MLADGTSFEVLIKGTCQATSAELGISTMTDSATVEVLIQETCNASCANLFEAPLACNTPWILKVVVDDTTEAAGLELAPTDSTIRTTRH